MNPFREVKVFVNFDTGHVVQWSIDPAFKSEPPFRFTLECSEVPSFEELVFSKVVDDNYFAVDNTNTKQNFSRAYLYRVKLETGDDRVFYSNHINYNAEGMGQKYLTASEIIRKEFVRMQYTGLKGWLLKRKVYINIQAQTVDSITGIPLTDNPEDYGTGIVGGYYKPIKVLYNMEGIEESEELAKTGFGVNEQVSAAVRMVGFPIVDVKDILVDSKGERFICLAVKNKFFPGTHVSILQTCSFGRIPNTDSIYKINIETL